MRNTVVAGRVGSGDWCLLLAFFEFGAFEGCYAGLTDLILIDRDIFGLGERRLNVLCLTSFVCVPGVGIHIPILETWITQYTPEMTN